MVEKKVSPISKLKLYIGAGISAISTLGLVQFAKADVLSTTTLATAIDNTSSSFYDMFLVFLAHAWPFILGATVLIGLVILALSIVRRLFHG